MINTYISKLTLENIPIIGIIKIKKKKLNTAMLKNLYKTFYEAFSHSLIQISLYLLISAGSICITLGLSNKL